MFSFYPQGQGNALSQVPDYCATAHILIPLALCLEAGSWYGFDSCQFFCKDICVLMYFSFFINFHTLTEDHACLLWYTYVYSLSIIFVLSVVQHASLYRGICQKQVKIILNVVPSNMCRFGDLSCYLSYGIFVHVQFLNRLHITFLRH